jgi:hypothetical protein
VATRFEVARTAIKFMGSGVTKGQMLLLSKYKDDPWEVYAGIYY